MTVHELKCHPEPFEQVRNGNKTHEVRSTRDRTFAVGDVLVLREWRPWAAHGDVEHGRLITFPPGYTGRHLRKLVTYISQPGTWGMPLDVCVLSLAPAPE